MIKHKMYPVYKTLLSKGVRPRIARKMVVDAILNAPSIVPSTCHVECFVRWSDTNYEHKWEEVCFG